MRTYETEWILDASTTTISIMIVYMDIIVRCKSAEFLKI